jgi:NADPH:quinone reductase-like Zn-dependent oxidoreductase
MPIRAAVIDRPGPPEAMRIAEREVPTPGLGQLLVEVVAAGVNPVDATNRSDPSWAGIELPATLGSDAAGIVAAVGPAVTDFQVGDDVYYFSDFLGVREGSYAEYQVVDASIVARGGVGTFAVQRAREPPVDAVVDLVGDAAARAIEVLGEGGAIGSGRGALRPVVAEEYALEDIAAAHRQIESAHTFGKLVIRMRSEP